MDNAARVDLWITPSGLPTTPHSLGQRFALPTLSTTTTSTDDEDEGLVCLLGLHHKNENLREQEI